VHSFQEKKAHLISVTEKKLLARYLVTSETNEKGEKLSWKKLAGYKGIQAVKNIVTITSCA
jgi:hypothetical protein